MRSHILITGTALAFAASPALAGGAGRAGALGGISGSTHGLFGGLGQGSVGRTNNSLNRCLCNTVGTPLGAARGPRGVARMPRNAAGAAGLVNSVAGLNGLGVGQSHANRHGSVQAIGLAGVVAGSVNGVASAGSRSGNASHGLGLAGTVANSVGTSLAGQVGRGHGEGLSLAYGNHRATTQNRLSMHRGSAINLSVGKETSGRAGRLANVSLVNGKATSGRSAINVEALNRTGGTSGRFVNVAVLNGKGTAGRSTINVAALNGRGEGTGKLVNAARLNALPAKGAGNGIRIINGVPCRPDGTPLTGAAATAALAALSASGPNGSAPGTGLGRGQASGRSARVQQESGRDGRNLSHNPKVGAQQAARSQMYGGPSS